MARKEVICFYSHADHPTCPSRISSSEISLPSAASGAFLSVCGSNLGSMMENFSGSASRRPLSFSKADFKLPWLLIRPSGVNATTKCATGDTRVTLWVYRPSLSAVRISIGIFPTHRDDQRATFDKFTLQTFVHYPLSRVRIKGRKNLYPAR